MNTVCAKDLCNGCMLCKTVCPHDAIHVEVGWKSCNASMDEAKCIQCGLCSRLCPRNRPPPFFPPREWYQGWAEDPDVRHQSSSGGLATALALQFIREGGICVGCVFREGRFVFDKAESAEEAMEDQMFRNANMDGLRKVKEFERAYRAKADHNLKRDFVGEHAHYLKSEE